MSDFFAVNGTIVPAEQATISVLDLGFLRGVGAFETFRTYGGGHPHALADHLARLWESGAAVGMTPFFDEAAVRRLVAEIRTRSGHDEMRVNVVATPGPHTHGVFGAADPTWVLIARDLHAPAESMYEQGVTAVTFDAARHLPEHKTTNYLVGRTGMMQAEKAGAHEAFYVGPDGLVSEGVTSNLLIVRGSTVITPCGNCLPGITKAGVQPIAEAAGMSWTDGDVTRTDLYAADEIWITSAVREILPIVAVDGHTIGTGKPGRWATTLRPLYHQRCVAEARRDAGL